METQRATREFEDVRINVPWGHVVGRWYGNRQVRPILALHGWLDNIGTWDNLIPLLPQHIGVLCIDLPGHGQSSRYPKGMTYHVIDYVHIIIRVMKEYSWQKVSLMGHSMGSIVCFMYAAINPRTVDLLVAFDVIKTPYRSPNYELRGFAHKIEKTLIEDERLDSLALQEPPSYTYAQLEKLMYEGSYESVAMENTKYLLNRSIAKSTKYPDKYYFSRDGKVKFYIEYNATLALSLEMAKRIRNVPYFVIKGSKSTYINEDSNELIDILRRQNPHFELHELEGTHHVHLNGAKEVAALLVPYINRHRPASLDTWTMDEDVGSKEEDNKALMLRQHQHNAKSSKIKSKSKL